MKTIFAALLLSALSFGQMPMTKAQKKDCDNAVKAAKKSNPAKLSVEEYKALLDAMNLACGTPEDYAAKHGAAGGIRDADRLSADCSKALEAMNVSASDSTVSLSDFQVLNAAAHKACGIPDEHTTPPDSHREDLVKEKERIDSVVGNSIVPNDSPPSASKPNAPGASDVAAPTATQDSRTKDSPPDIHVLVAQSSTALNREIAQGNRLIAHLQKAQTWEGIDANHPEAMALREKISQEEKELREAASASSKIMDSIDVHLAQKSCSPEEVDHWVSLVTEATGVCSRMSRLNRIVITLWDTK